MAYSYGVRAEFLRWIFASATSEATTVTLILDALSATALESAASGKSLVGTSANGNSASFQVFSSWDPQELLALVNWARTYQGQTSITTAIAAMNGPARSYRHEFTAMQV